MARAEGKGVALAVIALLALAPLAAGQAENLSGHLPAAADLEPLKLQIGKLLAVEPRELQRSRCNATASAGAFENILLLLPPDPLGRPRSDDPLARVTLYRFDSPGEAGTFFDCMVEARKGGPGLGRVGSARYGDRGVVAEPSNDSVTGASLLFIRGPYLVAVDSLQEAFPSDRSHALAKMVDGRLPKETPKTPGFEAVGALAGLVVVAYLRARKQT